eukprot:TRINITY_DN10064_c0_g2_i3.p4 TRINITY_DN10064_c0_g2~~TRINITY_DN10064_c0_g2_i3.p4  ORF type:complete len:123 (+),score=2.11 TRINITY_DN10064_c0_g2_i3:931-1299(+)
MLQKPLSTQFSQNQKISQQMIVQQINKIYKYYFLQIQHALCLKSWIKSVKMQEMMLVSIQNSKLKFQNFQNGTKSFVQYNKNKKKKTINSPNNIQIMPIPTIKKSVSHIILFVANKDICQNF